MPSEHYCNPALLPGECLVCVGRPRPFVRIESWAGSEVVEVEILGRTEHRTRIRLLSDNRKGKRGDVRMVAHGVVKEPRRG